MESTEIERLTKKIQPPMADRLRIIEPRHVACLRECVPKANVSTIGKALEQRTRLRKPCVTDSSRMRKDKTSLVDVSEGKGTSRDDKKEEEQDETPGEEATVGTEEKDEEVGEGKMNENETTVKQAPKMSGRKDDVAKKGRKKTQRRKEPRKSAQEDECQSVCSFDSDVCLAGLKLTAEDKKEIKDNRRRVRNEASIETK